MGAGTCLLRSVMSVEHRALNRFSMYSVSSSDFGSLLLYGATACMATQHLSAGSCYSIYWTSSTIGSELEMLLQAELARPTQQSQLSTQLCILPATPETELGGHTCRIASMPLRSAAFCALLWLLCSSSASVSPTAPLLTSNSRGFSLFSIQLSTFVLPTSSSATCK